MQHQVVVFVLAGGRGHRLYPLTKERAKPAIPFGGKYRIIDFVLRNLINIRAFIRSMCWFSTRASPSCVTFETAGSSAAY